MKLTIERNTNHYLLLLFLALLLLLSSNKLSLSLFCEHLLTQNRKLSKMKTNFSLSLQPTCCPQASS